MKQIVAELFVVGLGVSLLGSCVSTAGLEEEADSNDGVVSAEPACFLAGAALGELNADLYCDLALLLPTELPSDSSLIGPRAELGDCESEAALFSAGCRASFVETVETAEHPNGSCEMFTQPPFEDVFHEYMLLACGAL